MTAVESRLTATLAKHHTTVQYGMGDWTPTCACGWSAPSCDRHEQAVAANAAHQAAVIASSDDLAVIELPEPEVDRVGCKGWAEFQVYCAPGSDKVRIAPEDHRQPIEAARAIAAGILAAAKAAEEVDRGDN